MIQIKMGFGEETTPKVSQIIRKVISMQNYLEIRSEDVGKRSYVLRLNTLWIVRFTLLSLFIMYVSTKRLGRRDQ